METIRVRENHSFSCRHNCRNPLLIIMRLALIPRLIARSWIKYHLWRLGQHSIRGKTINGLLVAGPRCFPEVQVFTAQAARPPDEEHPEESPEEPPADEPPEEEPPVEPPEEEPPEEIELPPEEDVPLTPPSDEEPVMPKTGEEPPYPYYLLGGLAILAGVSLAGSRKRR